MSANKKVKPSRKANIHPRLPASADGERNTQMGAAAAAVDDFFPTEQAGSRSFPACLVLNADYSPLSYVPLSLWSWQDTVRAVLRGSANVVAEYEDFMIRSPSLQLNLPSVIALKQYVPVQGSAPPAFTRRNVFLRDGFCCQYCENKFPIGQLTYDHVIPVSRKGPNAWTNVVTACNYCNGKKGNKLLKDTDMKLKVQPYMPTRYELQRKARQYPPKNLHADWKDYV